jgi:hypothetical protein
MGAFAVLRRRRFKQSETLEQRLSAEAAKLRNQAQVTPPGKDRERLIRRARHAEAAAHMSEWLKSPELQRPK